MLAMAAIFLLVILFSRQLSLTLSVMVALSGILVFCAGGGLLLLKLSRRLSSNAGSLWRLAVGNLQRQRGQSLVHMVVFAIAIMLLFRSEEHTSELQSRGHLVCGLLLDIKK